MPILDMKTALLLVLVVLLAIPATALVAPGRITVYSVPTGALACVDNAECDTTGATFTAEGNAYHTVVVTEKGYLQWTDNVYVTSDQASVVNAYLDLNPDVTGVQVFVTPGGGTICLDNGDCRANVGTTGSTGSTQFAGVSAGYHTISVESPAGYEDTSKLVNVELGKISDVSIALDPVTTPVAIPVTNPATGSIRVYVDHTGSTICIDGGDCFINVGGTPGPGTGTTVFSEVTANEAHTISVTEDGYQPVSAKVAVGEDQISTVDVTLQSLGEETTVPPLTPTFTQTLQPTEPTPLPTRAGLDAIPVLGALTLCIALFLFRNGTS